MHLVSTNKSELLEGKASSCFMDLHGLSGVYWAVNNSWNHWSFINTRSITHWYASIQLNRGLMFLYPRLWWVAQCQIHHKMKMEMIQGTYQHKLQCPRHFQCCGLCSSSAKDCHYVSQHELHLGALCGTACKSYSHIINTSDSSWIFYSFIAFIH